MIIVAFADIHDNIECFGAVAEDLSTADAVLLERMQPVLCVTGHIHEGRGMDSIGRTRVVNPGPLSRGGYVYARVGRRVEALEIRGEKRSG